MDKEAIKLSRLRKEEIFQNSIKSLEVVQHDTRLFFLRQCKQFMAKIMDSN